MLYIRRNAHNATLALSIGQNDALVVDMPQWGSAGQVLLRSENRRKVQVAHCSRGQACAPRRKHASQTLDPIYRMTVPLLLVSPSKEIRMDVASAIRLGACLPVVVTNAMSRQRFVGCEHGMACQ